MPAALWSAVAQLPLLRPRPKENLSTTLRAARLLLSQPKGLWFSGCSFFSFVPSSSPRPLRPLGYLCVELFSSLILIPKKQMRNRHQQNRPHRRRCQRKQKRIRVHNPQLRKNPSPNHRPDQPDQNISDTPESPSPRHLPRQPPRQQPNHQPPNQPPLPLHDHHPFLQKSNHPKHPTHQSLPILRCALSVSALSYLLFAF